MSSEGERGLQFLFILFFFFLKSLLRYFRLCYYLRVMNVVSILIKVLLIFFRGLCFLYVFFLSSVHTCIVFFKFQKLKIFEKTCWFFQFPCVHYSFLTVSWLCLIIIGQIDATIRRILRGG